MSLRHKRKNCLIGDFMNAKRKHIFYSRLFFLVGLVLIYLTREAFDERQIYKIFYYASMSLHAFILALQPQILLNQVTLMNFFMNDIPRTGMVSFLTIVANILFIIATITWLFHKNIIF